MPKPQKGESKQDYLGRCTRELIDKEGKEADQAFATCNAYWDDAKSQRSALTLSAPLTLAAAGQEGEAPRSFLVTAYTGATVEAWWGKVVIALTGIKAANKLPVLREHFRDRVVGFSIKSWKDKQNFMIQGEFSQKTQDGQEVYDLAGEGFPWQASIGVMPERIQILQNEKETAKVNGREVVGPLEIWLESTVREVSFCALGADGDSAAIALKESQNQEKVPVIIERAKIKEAEGLMEITLKLLEEKAPGLLKEIRDAAREEGLAGITLEIFRERHPATVDKFRAEGQDRERTRVMEILEADGDHAISLVAIKEGTLAAETFKMLFKAEKEGRDKALEAMKAGAPLPLGQKLPAGPGGETFEAKVTAIMAEQKITRGKAVKTAAQEFPELHEEYIARCNPAKK